MFSRPQKDPNQPEPRDFQDVRFPLKKSLDSEMNKIDEKLENMAENKPEVVTVVEKVSAILSPYFIALVGLILYDNNVLIGTILIAIGILSLLGVSWKDIKKLTEEVKNFFGSNQSEQ